MTKYRLALDEQETTINWTKADKIACITTCDTKIINYLRKNLIKEIKSDKDFIPVCVTFEVPILWVKISKPRTRTMTDEQKAQATERLKLI